jgi:hypothetical protein
MKLAIILISAIPVFAATSILDIEVTNTQAVVQYKTTEAGACTIRASEGQTLGTMVHDVNTTLFSGSNQDDRTSNWPRKVSGTTRWFTLGQRTVGQAADSKWYSRALQRAKQHVVGITCGGDAEVTKVFTTANTTGGIYPESPIFNANAPFRQAWPTINYADKSVEYIDPFTGVLIKRATGGDQGYRGLTSNNAFSYVSDISAAWTDEANAINTSTGPFASTSTAGAPLVLGSTTFASTGFNADAANEPWSHAYTILDVRLSMYGYSSEATAANREVDVCFGKEDGTCVGTANTMTVAQGSGPGSAGTVLHPSSGFPVPVMGSWAGLMPTFKYAHLVPYSGTATVSGATVTRTGGAYFFAEWEAGRKITLNGTDCLIASVQSHTTLTLSTSCGSTGNYTVSGLRLIAKKKNGVGTVNVSFRFDLAWKGPMGEFNGFTDCGTTATTVDGRTAYRCVNGSTNEATGAYLFFPDNGEYRQYTDHNISSSPGIASAADRISTGIPPAVTGTGIQGTHDTWVWQRVGDGSGDYNLFKLTYTGDWSVYTPPIGTRVQNHTQANVFPKSTGNSAFDMTRAHIAANWPTFYTGAGDTGFSASEFVGLTPDGKAGLSIKTGQDEPCWLYLLNLDSASIYHGKSSFSDTGGRWGGCHTFGIEAGNGAWISAVPIGLEQRDGNPSRFLGGPFKMTVEQVKKSGVWDNTPDLSATEAETCDFTGVDTATVLKYTDRYTPWNNPGTARCIWVEVDHEPYSVAPNTTVGEHTRFPCSWNVNYSCLQTIEPGDWLSNPYADAVPGGFSSGSEKFVVLKKVNNGDKRQLYLYRWVGPPMESALNTNYRTHGPAGAQWVLWAWPTETSDGIPWHLVADDPTADFVHEAQDGLVGHPANGKGTAGGDYLTDCQSGYICRVNQLFADVVGTRGNSTSVSSVRVTDGPLFGGVAAGISAGALQTYLDGPSEAVPTVMRGRFSDFRHTNHSNGSGAETKDGMCTMAAAPALQATTTQVYKIASGCGAYDRRIPMFAQAGPYQMADMSGPGVTITDSDEGKYCIANRANECRTGSSIGDIYVSSKWWDNTTTCYRNTNEATNPCVYRPLPVMGWGVVFSLAAAENEGNAVQRVTMAMNGPGRQYHFTKLSVMPDGQWFLFPSAWTNGISSDWYLAKVPLPDRDTTNRSTWVPVKINVGSGLTAGKVVAKFGYGEYGTATSYYGTTRAENTVATGATVNLTTPFEFYDGTANDEVDGTDGQDCASGCTITIPAIAGRVVYWELFANSSGTLTSLGVSGVRAVR